MNASVQPAKLSGTIGAIASKSEAHRQLILSSLCQTPTRVIMRGKCDDTEATGACLEALGAKIEWDDEGATVFPDESPVYVNLDARESGSTLRFLIPVALAKCESVSFTGRGRLPERPLTHLIDALKSGGASFSSDRLPLSAKGKIKSGVYTVPGNISSQYVTGLLLALPLLNGDSEIRVIGPLQSKAYVDITLRAMEKFALSVQKTETGFFIKGNQTPVSPGTVTVDGDWSNAAFFLAAGAIGNEGVSVSGLQADAAQGDKKIIALLRAFGAQITENNGTFTVKGGRLHAAEIDIDEVPDLIAPLAVTAMFAEGKTAFVNGARLRLKESDRIRAMREMIENMGGQAEETGDQLIVYGKKPTGGRVNGMNDHRIVMAAAIAGAYSENGAVISHAEAVNKSYPAFYRDFEKMGGKADVL
ncbi:MAG: 3-phosphoshikimate 1-carboxyvinyltransferase [Clostridia bacterium]|nr:3-phosphoshikimate 1-carboxyvinyltransferase [Clostridia bacterium]MBQ4156985.1 3-phosphoshikimate 1-carboxyvinyltransferase [Clostridia bacterium]